jgi:hypothetical protein
MSATGFANSALTSSLIAEVVSKTLLSKDALFFEFDKFSDEVFCASATSSMATPSWHDLVQNNICMVYDNYTTIANRRQRKSR